jgi:hypothetical protein
MKLWTTCLHQLHLELAGECYFLGDKNKTRMRRMHGLKDMGRGITRLTKLRQIRRTKLSYKIAAVVKRHSSFVLFCHHTSGTLKHNSFDGHVHERTS